MRVEFDISREEQPVSVGIERDGFLHRVARRPRSAGTVAQYRVFEFVVRVDYTGLYVEAAQWCPLDVPAIGDALGLQFAVVNIFVVDEGVACAFYEAAPCFAEESVEFE